MTGAGRHPRHGIRRRLAAVVALAGLVLAVLYLVTQAVNRWEVLVSGTASLAVAVVAAWYVLTRRGARRYVALGVACAALIVFTVVIVATQSARVLVIGMGLAAISVAAAGVALRDGAVDVRPRAPVAHHPVLLMNPKSGGGKAERFTLAEQCRERGIEPIVLRPDKDLVALAEQAVADGADLIGMAGGDGSQALVASVASRHGIPHVVIPAGTRNHFALDLGLDRDDVVGALDAYTDGVERVVDLAEVNGRIFVNNASIGAYARVVQSPEYRDAKLRTAILMLPEILGPDAPPMDLQFTRPSGEEASSAALILVSNNQYDLHHFRGGGTRARIDDGVLGILTVHVGGGGTTDGRAEEGLPKSGQRLRGWNEWAATQFEVRSAGPVEIGIDGEALTMQPPLRFAIRPAALTVRVPRSAHQGSPGARIIRVASHSTVAALFRVARGCPAEDSYSRTSDPA